MPRDLHRVIGICVSLLAASAGGCGREFYRLRADRDAYGLIDRGECDPRWQIGRTTIQPAPQSRMFDPSNPDFPPMPPDDPTSHRLMHCVDGKAGYPCWHLSGDVPTVEPPGWPAALPIDDQGQLVLDLDQAIELGLVHSRDYQSQLEELYLSALDVSFERFRFDTQFFGGNDTFFTSQGREFGFGQARSQLDNNTFLEARKLLPTGGDLLVGFANDLMWQFSGPNQFSPTTTLNFQLIQPLLRAGGRDVVLERLTVAERTLLANLRSMQRYRQGFYVELATGRNAPAGPSRRGGFLGGAGLEGFSGIGAGGFGRVGGGGAAGGAGGFAGGAGAAQAGGFYGLLQQYREIENQRENVESLRQSHELLADFFIAGRLDNDLQVDQAGQALHDAESRLLTAERDYTASVENYLIDLGLPPDLPLVIQDDRLDQFELLDPGLTNLESLAARPRRMLLPDVGAPAAEGDLPLVAEGRSYRQELLDRQAQLERALTALGGVPEVWDEARRLQAVVDEAVDTATSDENLHARREQLRSVRELADEAEQVRGIELPTELQPGGDASTLRPWDDALLDDHLGKIREAQRVIARLLDERWEPPADAADDPWQICHEELAPVLPRTQTYAELLQQELAALVTEVQALPPDPPAEDAQARLQQLLTDEQRERLQLLDERIECVETLLGDLQFLASEMSLTRVRARLETISLKPHELAAPTALEIANEYRLDWMNARAAVVDSWRLIEFNADELESDLDVVFSGEINNTDDVPFRFRSTNAQLRAGLQFDAPLTRLGERNNYRQALIEYQQARRSYMQFVDQLYQGLRNTLRTMELNQLNFEIRRLAVWTATQQVDLARLRLFQPLRPGETASLGPTVARDLISALSDLLSVQNDFLSVWVNFEVLRMQLDMDLGTMQLDGRGLWIEPENIGGLAQEAGHFEEIPLGAPLEEFEGAPEAIDEGPQADPTDEAELPAEVPPPPLPGDFEELDLAPPAP
jgi:hypothetical protein